MKARTDNVSVVTSAFAPLAGERLLDVGCGGGALAPAVVRAGPAARSIVPEAGGWPAASGPALAPRAVVPIAFGVRVIGPGAPDGSARPGLPRVFVPGQAR